MGKHFLSNQFFTVPVLLSVSLSLVSGMAYAENPVNTVQDGGIVKGGTYFNTSGQETRFINSHGGSLWLQKGSNLRGVEVDAHGAYTNNGGSFNFYAPGSVVRLDGNIDVRGIQNGQGAFLGDGGKVSVNAAYLYQNGNIYANGINGGMVQFNVGSATLGNTARIEAKGFGGQGGIIDLRASGGVTVGSQVVLDSSGKVAGSVDGNLINIEGGAVQVQGYLAANGVESRGGTIRIVATGQSDLSQTQDALTQGVSNGVFTQSEANGINSQLSDLKATHDGDIVLASANGAIPQANLYANGASGGAAIGNDPVDTSSRAGDGGSVLLNAANNIENGGWIGVNGGNGVGVNGGNGGTLSLSAASQINNTGRLVTDGGRGVQGGSGGLQAYAYRTGMQSNGVIRAMGGQGTAGNGGNGGLIVFDTLLNPTGTGGVFTFGGLGAQQGKLGTIATFDPSLVSNPMYGVWSRTFQDETLVNGDALIFNYSLINSSGIPNPIGPVRSIQDHMATGDAKDALFSKLEDGNGIGNKPYYIRNVVFNANDNNPVYLPLALTLKNSSGQQINPSMLPFYSLSVNAEGYIELSNKTFAVGGVIADGVKAATPGHLSILSQGYAAKPESALYANAGYSLGSTNGASLVVAVKEGLSNATQTLSLGNNSSVIYKAGTNIGVSESSILGNEAGGTFNPNIVSGSNRTGGRFDFFAGNRFVNQDQIFNSGDQQAGSILIRAGNSILSATAFNGPGSVPSLLSATSPEYGGFIKLQAKNVDNPDPIQVNGGIQNGQIIIQETP